jgi:hypothetical protein
MKNFIIYIIFPLFFTDCFADCGDRGMRFLPLKKEISLNSIFIIEGYLNSQVTVKSFKNRNVFLKSENEILITLNLIEILESKYVSQAVFKANQVLLPNTKYELFIPNLTEMEKIEMSEYNSFSKKNEPIHWQTTNLFEQNGIDSSLKIVYNKNEVKSYGCGNSVKSVFDVRCNDNSEMFFKTELIEITTGEKTIMYLTKEDDGKIYVGKGMCGGPFIYKVNNKYKVRFVPTNTDGKTLEKTEWFEFKSPYDTEDYFMKRK